MTTKTFTIALVSTIASVQAEYQQWDIEVDYRDRWNTVFFESQDWSEATTDRSSVTISNNNHFTIKRNAWDGHDFAAKYLLRGGSVEYDVDLSQMDCGCVAGLYLVQDNEWCDPEAAQNGAPQCASIDVMQANKAGFNVSANPCANGTCDGVSQCQYDMSVQGKAKYGDDAYGPGGSLINTDSPFSVQTEFVSTKDYKQLWKLRTTLTQGNGMIEMEADCRDGYLSPFDVAIEGRMGFVVSNWDNRNYREHDFECKGQCPQAASSCDASKVSITNFMPRQAFSNEDIPEEESESEEEEEPTPQPAQMLPFNGYSDAMNGDWQFWIKGLDNKNLSTEMSLIKMGKDNRFFVRDYSTDSEESFWAYQHNYLGGTLEFDVNVKQLNCSCAAGVYLTALDDEDCTMNPYPWDVRPKCATIDVMESNIRGFNTASHPCEFDQCDVQSQCKRSAIDVDYKAYGFGSTFKINTMYNYTVRTQFMAEKGSGDEFDSLKSIVTTLVQDGEEVVIEQDCEDYLQPLAYKLNKQMALAVSFFDIGLDNDIDEGCSTVCNDSSTMDIQNFRFTTGDSYVEEEEDEVDPDDTFVVEGIAESLEDCKEGCTECHYGHYEKTPDTMRHICTDETVYKYTNACKERNDQSKCASGSDTMCFWSFAHGTTGQEKRDSKACRTIPAELIDGDMKYGRKSTNNFNKGLCKYGCDDGQTCNWSYLMDDADKWKGYSGMFRCKA